MGIQLELRIKINRVWVWGIGIWGFDLSCRAFEHPNMIALIFNHICNNNVALLGDPVILKIPSL